MHFEVLSWSATAPGADPGAVATPLANTGGQGDSMTIKHNVGAKRPFIFALWALQQASGYQQISFPTGHDTTRGYRTGVEATRTDFRLPPGMQLDVTTQELLTVIVVGSATAGDVELGCSLVCYPNQPGISQRNLKWEQLQKFAQKMTTIFCSVTGTAAGYSGAETIATDSNLLIANRDYAILGGETTVDCAAVTITGPDTGNVKIAFPGADDNADWTSQYFALMARLHDMPFIPVINAANRNSTFIGIAADENNPTVPITLYLALLEEGWDK
jgi:hypothetical protein